MKSSCALLLIFLPPFAEAAEGIQTFVPYPKTGVQLGAGWNSILGQKVSGVCIVASQDVDKGQNRDITYREVTDTSSLMQSLSVSAQAKVGILQSGTASATASFAKSAKLDNYGLNIAVDVRITDGETFLVPITQGNTAAKAMLKVGARVETTKMSNGSGDPIPAGTIRLTPWALKLAAHPLDFIKSCGDSYVATIRMGSGIQGVYTVETRSDAEKQSTAASLGASYGSFSTSATGDQQIEALESAGRVHINYTQQGGDGTIVATDDKTFRNLIQSIGTSVEPGTSPPVEIGLASYRDLANFPTAGAASDDQLFLMANQYFRLYSLDSQINEMLTQDATVSSGELGFFFDSRVTRESVAKTQDLIKADMQSLKSAIQACAPWTSCLFPSSVAKTDYVYRKQLPVRNAAVGSWNSLQMATNKLNSDLAQLAAVGVTPDHLFDAWIPIPNASYGPIIDDARRLTPVVQNLKQLQDSTNERYSLWVDSVSRERCDASDTDVCLDNAALQAIRDSMNADPILVP